MSETAKLFMKVTGSLSGDAIKGESRVANFAGQIEFDDWNWRVQRKQDKETLEPSVFSFSKLMDRASTGLLSAMKNGELLSVGISMEDVSQVQFRLDIRLERARIIRYDMKIKVGDKSGAVEETWDIDYENVRFDYSSGGMRGLSSITLVRPPDASKEPVETTGSRLIKLAGDMSKPELKDIWDKMLDAASGPAARPPARDKDDRGGGF